MRRYQPFHPSVSYASRFPGSLEKALAKAQVEDEVLGGKIRNALAMEKEGMETETALLKIGNDVSVFQTLPIAFFLISRYSNPGSSHGLREYRGNTDTIALLCGAYLGARKASMHFRKTCLTGLRTGSGSNCSGNGYIPFICINWSRCNAFLYFLLFLRI